MLHKQCTCGRSKFFPYCDGTHKIKEEATNFDLDQVKNNKEDKDVQR